VNVAEDCDMPFSLVSSAWRGFPGDFLSERGVTLQSMGDHGMYHGHVNAQYSSTYWCSCVVVCDCYFHSVLLLGHVHSTIRHSITSSWTGNMPSTETTIQSPATAGKLLNSNCCLCWTQVHVPQQRKGSHSLQLLRVHNTPQHCRNRCLIKAAISELG
jgi:hypothetical protein